MANPNFSDLTIRQLKAAARGKIRGYSRMTKAQLVAALDAYELATTPVADPTPEPEQPVSVESQPVICDLPAEPLPRAHRQVVTPPEFVDSNVAIARYALAAAIATPVYLGRLARRWVEREFGLSLTPVAA